MTESHEDPPIRGRQPAAEDLAVMALMDELRKRSLSSIEETAKQLISLNGLISGIYFGAVAISELPAAIAAMTENRLLFLAPVALWLAGLIAAVFVLTPKEYTFNPNSPDETRATYMALISTKHTRLKIALGLFIASLVALLLALWQYMNLVPLPHKP